MTVGSDGIILALSRLGYSTEDLMHTSFTRRRVHVAAFIATFSLFSQPSLAATPAGTGDTKTLSGKSGSGKIMTREELRACMNRQQELAASKTALDTRTQALQVEREAVEKQTAEVKAEQDVLMGRKGDVDGLNARMAAFSAKAKDYRERRADFEAADRTGPGADRERRLLDKEADELNKEQNALNAERDRVVGGSEQSVAAFNARVEQQQRAAQAWNEKSKQLTADQEAYEDRRVEWLDECANRRYREDDEKAIRAGK
jgi:predicted  nucleic acid-binding Zn-ribbon protein